MGLTGSDEYSEIDGVTFHGLTDTERAFEISTCEGSKAYIPRFAVSEDSEVHGGCEWGFVGTLIVRTSIAIEKGLVGRSRGSSVGFVSKKVGRRVVRPELMSESMLLGITDRAAIIRDGFGGLEWRYDDKMILDEGGNPIAMVEDVGTAKLIGMMPFDLWQLLDEVHRLRAWVDRVT